MTNHGEWRGTLQDLVDGGALTVGDGYRTRVDQLSPDGIPILRAADIQTGSVRHGTADAINFEYLPKIGAKVSASEDVVITTKGTVGRSVMIPKGFENHAYSPQLCYLRVFDRTCLLPRYLYCWVRSPSFKVQLDSYKGLTDMAPYVNLKDLKSFYLTLPPMEEQERIAGVLGAFDDLIETNRRLAQQLDEVRRVRVAAALAESSFETRLSDAAAFVNGRNFTKGADGTGRPVIRTPEVRSGPVGNTVWSSVAAADDRVANPGDILFVWSGTLMVNRWLYTEGLVNQHVFKVIPNGVPDWYVYALIEAQLTWFLGLAKDKATTMGHIQRAHLDEPMIGLDIETIERLDNAIEPVWTAALDLRLEARDLARQRDELLPLLMSGRVRVRDVEAAVS